MANFVHFEDTLPPLSLSTDVDIVSRLNNKTSKVECKKALA